MSRSVGRFVIAFVAAAASVAGSGQGNGDAVPPGVRYLGQKPPGTTPVRFAPGIVSTDAIEINGVFRHDFREFFFARQVDGVLRLGGNLELPSRPGEHFRDEPARIGIVINNQNVCHQQCPCASLPAPPAGQS